MQRTLANHPLRFKTLRCALNFLLSQNPFSSIPSLSLLYCLLFPPLPSSAPLYREAFNVAEEDHEKILAEIKDHILHLAQNFSAKISVKGMGHNNQAQSIECTHVLEHDEIIDYMWHHMTRPLGHMRDHMTGPLGHMRDHTWLAHVHCITSLSQCLLHKVWTLQSSQVRIFHSNTS